MSEQIVDAYERGREIGLKVLLERHNRTPEWFHKAGVYHSHRWYTAKKARAHFMDGWLSNWPQARLEHGERP